MRTLEAPSIMALRAACMNLHLKSSGRSVKQATSGGSLRRCALAATQSRLHSSISAAMGSVPDALKDVVPTLAPTGVELQVKYPTFEAKDGVLVPPSAAAHQPMVHITGAQASKKYTLAMVDPDAPSPEHPVNAQFLHWLIVNAPADHVTKGHELTPYMGPAPPKGVHRYIVLVFEEPAPVHAKPVDKRPKFDIMKWSHESGLGPAAAVTWFTSAPEEELQRHRV